MFAAIRCIDDRRYFTGSKSAPRRQQLGRSSLRGREGGDESKPGQPRNLGRMGVIH